MGQFSIISVCTHIHSCPVSETPSFCRAGQRGLLDEALPFAVGVWAWGSVGVAGTRLVGVAVVGDGERVGRTSFAETDLTHTPPNNYYIRQ